MCLSNIQTKADEMKTYTILERTGGAYSVISNNEAEAACRVLSENDTQGHVEILSAGLTEDQARDEFDRLTAQR